MSNQSWPGVSSLVLNEPLLWEKGRPGRVGVSLPESDVPAAPYEAEGMVRTELNLPDLAELDVVRHYTRLSTWNFGVDTGMYPLGSCTMKYNPKINEKIAALPGFAGAHPLFPSEYSQGALRVLYETEQMLCAVTGLEACSLQPSAGAHGELTGIMLIQAWHRAQGNTRTKMLIPDSAHGTNPASAVLAGFEIVNVPSRDGMVDPAALEEALAKYPDQVAGLMMTNPNTLGLLELHLPRIVEVLRREDALLYYDGANMNAILGKMRVGDVGFDVVHLNVHKTLGTPHGGGGPGCGPVGVGERLLPFLPAPRVRKAEDGSYALDYDLPQSIGHIGPFYGSFGVVLKALAYMMRLGAEGLTRAAEFASLNANYLRKKLEGVLDVPFDRICAHEFVASAPEGLRALDIAKALLDRGFHAPTVYFPLIVHECLMAEPTETESKQTLDAYIEALREIVALGKSDPQQLLDAPVKMPVRRLDETAAARHMILTEDMA